MYSCINGKCLNMVDSMKPTWVWGTVNPCGENNDANTLYLTQSEISDLVDNNKLCNLPVKVEHSGDSIGRVVCAWKSQQGLDVLAEINSSLPGAIASSYVRTKRLQDFSLGYNVSVQYSEQAGTYRPSRKSFTEVSLVRNGARKSCHVHAISVEDDVKMKTKVQECLRSNKLDALLQVFSSTG
jgi:hypothetical protein